MYLSLLFLLHHSDWADILFACHREVVGPVVHAKEDFFPPVLEGDTHNAEELREAVEAPAGTAERTEQIAGLQDNQDFLTSNTIST